VSILVVANSAKDWPFQIAKAEVVDARSYLTEPRFSDMRGTKIFNLCRSYRYQSIGYYVSLLAEARGQKPMPSITTIQDFKSNAIVRLVSEELDELIQTSLSPIKSEEFTLSIYFGRNLAKRYDRLCLQLFNQFQAPLLRATFAHDDNHWELRRVAALSSNDVPEAHWPFVVEMATEHVSGRRPTFKKKTEPRFDMAILINPKDPEPPSNEKALKKFIKAAEAAHISAELITRDDYGRIAEFDALFIRETTQVNHHTYRFSRRAASEGLVVMDDPQSIVRCTNKVYLAELLNRHKVPIPKTLVVHRDNAELIPNTLGLPCVLKKPDSAFSQGVVKVNNAEELKTRLEEFFAQSDLIIAQEFLPTTFDWRIGIIDKQPLFAAKYHMAPGHWQIIKRDANGDDRFGKFDVVPVELAPIRAVQVALKAANLIGDGFYGVDVKQSNGKFYVIEVNDNPNLDAGIEDTLLKDELYRRIINVFLYRMEQRKARIS
jgi:glutathione synthase/RimK-type ligase-like ATP-grasp enzyme